jgi:hypothetical protein
VLGFEILAKNSADGQETISKSVSRMTDKQFKIWKLGKEIERRIRKLGLGYI